MKPVRLFLTRAALLSAVALLHTACPSTQNESGIIEDGSPVGDAATVSEEFLASENSALNRWLDETFDLEYKFMTLGVIFEQDPINDIRYELKDLPTTDDMFELKQAGISRRELLFKVAEFFQLDMAVTGNAVLVSGKK